MSVVVRQLSKAYGYLWALKETNLEFRDGDCVALLGPNGAGKTTLLKLLSALLYPTTGEIEIDGERLRRGNSDLRAAIGFLSPDGQIYDNLTAKENLHFFVSLCGKKNRSPGTGSGLGSGGSQGLVRCLCLLPFSWHEMPSSHRQMVPFTTEGPIAG